MQFCNNGCADVLHMLLHQTLYRCGWMELQIHSLLISALYVGNQSTAYAGRFTLPELSALTDNLSIGGWTGFTDG